ncbi:hypothetical protein LJC31_03415 [Synergistaceae bacterium OttesenSCG-928-I11]|nr:hypothetical protein [Synergistaceae bacterium OttesenSCG-928-I11]
MNKATGPDNEAPVGVAMTEESSLGGKAEQIYLEKLANLKSGKHMITLGDTEDRIKRLKESIGKDTDDLKVRRWVFPHPPT